jgi:hypothetical protein
MLGQALSIERMPRRGFPPVCILISDGFCTDPEEEYNNAIAELNRIPWGMKSIRLAIALGEETEYNEKELLKFVNQPNVGLLKAHNAEELLRYIKWASTEATLSSSRSKSKDLKDDSTNVVLSTPPPTITSSTEPF